VFFVPYINEIEGKKRRKGQKKTGIVGLLFFPESGTFKELPKSIEIKEEDIKYPVSIFSHPPINLYLAVDSLLGDNNSPPLVRGHLCNDNQVNFLGVSYAVSIKTVDMPLF